MDPNKEIVNYTDYRQFLKDFFEVKKNEKGGYSYKAMATRAGFASASFQRMVLEGEKNISVESAIKIARALKLNKKASEYFESIVSFTQAKDLDTKEYFLSKIDRYRKKNRPNLLLAEEYDYLKEWFHVVVRETVELKSFTEESKKLNKLFTMGIPPADVEKSLAFLIKNGFLIRNEDGKLIKKEKTLATHNIPQDEEIVVIAKRYHISMLEQAIKAIKILPRDKRNISNTTLSFSPKSYEVAVKRIENLRFELLELASTDEEVDRVCQLNINLFTLVDNNDETTN